MKKSVAALLISAVAAVGHFRSQVVSIPSCVITPLTEHETWSKRDMQRMKGKAARKNRGRNRSKHEIH